MLRSLTIALCAVSALPIGVASANPSVAVTSERVGSTAKLPAKVKHVLTLTAGATAEQVTVDIDPATPLTVTGAQTVSPPPPSAGPSLSICSTRWSFRRETYATSTVTNLRTMTIAPGTTAVVEATVQLVGPPSEGQGLDAEWEITPAQGRPFTVSSMAPFYTGPFGVDIDFRVLRARDGSYVIAGTTAPADVSSGRAELWAYAPSSKRAKRIASVPVRDGAWSTGAFRPDRRGKWELYARYRSATRGYADGATPCGTEVRVR
jgi:hypothetical protein